MPKSYKFGQTMKWFANMCYHFRGGEANSRAGWNINICKQVEPTSRIIKSPSLNSNRIEGS